MTANSRSQQEKNKEAEATTRNPPLAQEVRTYETHLPGWADREGQFVLIKGRGVLGFYPRHENALDAGYDRLGGGPFLVKQVLSKCRGDSAAAAGPNATITTIGAGRSRGAAVLISPLQGYGTKGRNGPSHRMQGHPVALAVEDHGPEAVRADLVLGPEHLAAV